MPSSTPESVSIRHIGILRNESKNNSARVEYTMPETSGGHGPHRHRGLPSMYHLLPAPVSMLCGQGSAVRPGFRASTAPTPSHF